MQIVTNVIMSKQSFVIVYLVIDTMYV